MSAILKKLFSKRKSGISDGLQGDKHLLRVLDSVLEGCEYVIGTGDGAASILANLGARHPRLECLACEPNSEKCFAIQNSAANLKNVYVHNRSPGKFLQVIKADKPYLFSRDILFLLSAAGGGAERRMLGEIEFVTGHFGAAFMLVHGFKVPDRDEFSFDVQRGRACSFENIKKSLGTAEYSLFYPSYPVRASMRRSVKGWGLFAFGRNMGHEFPGDVSAFLTKAG